jgi:hypothetical protein
MAGTVIADIVQAASTSQLNIKNGVALTPPTIADVNGVAIGTFCRAWVNFSAATTVPVIRGSFNVSSITDNGVGDYTVNFTNAMTDANYAMVSSGGGDSLSNRPDPIGTNTTTAPTASAIRLIQWYMTGTTTQSPIDATWNNIAIFR